MSLLAYDTVVTKQCHGISFRLLLVRCHKSTFKSKANVINDSSGSLVWARQDYHVSSLQQYYAFWTVTSMTNPFRFLTLHFLWPFNLMLEWGVLFLPTSFLIKARRLLYGVSLLMHINYYNCSVSWHKIKFCVYLILHTQLQLPSCPVTAIVTLKFQTFLTTDVKALKRAPSIHPILVGRLSHTWWWQQVV